MVTNGQQQRPESQNSWTWEEILDGKGPWAQAGEYRRPQAELEAVKTERRRYEKAARQRGWKPERQPQKCIGGGTRGVWRSQVGDLRQLPVLTVERTVSPVRMLSPVGYIPAPRIAGLECASSQVP